MENNAQCACMSMMKASHVEECVMEDLISKMQDEYGKEAPLTVSHGKVLEYLGMKIDYSNAGKVVFSMQEYVKNILEECPDELLKAGTATTSAASHILNINPSALKLGKEQAEIFHHLVAKLLYLSKRT